MKRTLEHICPGFEDWPNRWMGLAEDLDYGQGLLDAMRPFAQAMLDSNLTPKTIRAHMDNLWLLGGQIIREVSLYNEYDTPPREKLREAVDAEGGPLCKHLQTEAEERAFDRTCRRLHKFLEAGRSAP